MGQKIIQGLECKTTPASLTLGWIVLKMRWRIDYWQGRYRVIPECEWWNCFWRAGHMMLPRCLPSIAALQASHHTKLWVFMPRNVMIAAPTPYASIAIIGPLITGLFMRMQPIKWMGLPYALEDLDYLARKDLKTTALLSEFCIEINQRLGNKSKMAQSHIGLPPETWLNNIDTANRSTLCSMR
jgi:hypothetical protein